MKPKNKELQEGVEETVITRKVTISELPVGISEQGEVVCIPRTTDPPRIGIVGASGKGKTLLLGALAGRMYWYWQNMLFWGNDDKGETPSFLKAMHGTDLFDERLATLNETATALPVILCLPDSEDFNYEEEIPFIKICLPYDRFLEDPKRYIEIANTARYITEMKDELKDINSPEEAVSVFKARYGNNKTMIDSFSSIINLIFEKRLFDINSDGVSKLIIDDLEYNPIIGCMALGLVPSLYTGDIMDEEEFFSNYYYNLLKEIYDIQRNPNSLFYKEARRICFVIDEISLISNKSNSKENRADKIINKCMRQGRFTRICVIWATQNITDINPKITANTNYMFAFATGEKKEHDIIRKNYNIPKYLVDDLKSLNTFECMAITNDHFVIYDKDGNRREEREPKRIICLPPLEFHQQPRQQELIPDVN